MVRMKAYRICGEIEQLEEYYRASGARDGYRTECKACNRAMSARRYRENPEPARERAKQWNQTHRDRYNERMAAYKETGKKEISDRKSYLKRT